MTRILTLFAALTASAGVACVAPAPGGGTSPDPTDNPTETDTDPDSVDVPLLVWDDADACWRVEIFALDSAYWESYWPECEIPAANAPILQYGTTDGRCIEVARGFGLPGEEWVQLNSPSCMVEDPWILECSAVPGCCAHRYNDFCPVETVTRYDTEPSTYVRPEAL